MNASIPVIISLDLKLFGTLRQYYCFSVCVSAVMYTPLVHVCVTVC